MRMKPYSLKILMIFLLLIAALPAVAQPPPPDPEPIPIDGGLISLLVGGAFLAIKNVVKQKQK